MWLTKLAPKKFLCRFCLSGGSLFIGIFTLVLAILCVIFIALEIVHFKRCTDCTVRVLHNAYSFTINAIIYGIIMIFVNCWFIWGVKNKKSSVVLSWVVITALWWIQSFLLIFVLLCLNVTDTSIGWIMTFVCVIISFMVFGYFILVVFGYWLQLRKPSQPRVDD